MTSAARALAAVSLLAASLALQLQWSFADELLSVDDLENLISPEDLAKFSENTDGDASASTPEGQWIGNRHWDTADSDDDFLAMERIGPRIGSFDNDKTSVPKEVDCFGAGVVASRFRWLINLRPASSKEINTHFFFSSRKQRTRVQVYPGEQFGLEWVDYEPKRQTVVIIHGFMSHSNASWVVNMTNAFLDWGDVNVMTVDWSGGGRTWKYWRAVANTRQVGADVTQFLRQLMHATGCVTRDFHFVGHSLGAHICSYAAAHLGGVRRITGLDPAQPCFATSDKSVLLDSSDAEFVDVIHTNGRLMKRLGLGMPDPSGHADFYPNGGMKQPGCYKKNGFFARVLPISPTKLRQAVCSHGRAYILFTESLLSRNCSFRAHPWNMTFEGYPKDGKLKEKWIKGSVHKVNASLQAACDRIGSCAEMGINAEGAPGSYQRARGQYFVLTTDTRPYCPSEFQRHNPSPVLLRDLTKGFQLDRTRSASSTPPPILGAQIGGSIIVYADPDLRSISSAATTTKKPFWKFWK